MLVPYLERNAEGTGSKSKHDTSARERGGGPRLYARAVGDDDSSDGPRSALHVGRPLLVLGKA